MSRKRITVLFIVFIMLVGTLTACGKDSNGIEITNVSYDPTRELYEAYNKEFIKYWKDKTGEDVTITQSHGGSGKQARSVIEGNEADVVTLALAHDVTAIEEAGLIDSGWINEFDKNSSPYTSTIVFLVRKDNAKNIKDWNDLIKDGVEVITPNPKTSGGACWNFLAAWAYAEQLYNGDEASMKDFVTKLYQNVIVLDSGARGATTTFVENGQGDVLIAWENEAYLSVKEHPDEFEIITPSISILAEPSVAVVDETVNRRDTAEVSKAYLEYLYSDTAQRIAGDNFYRPSNPDILKEYEDVFDLNVNLVTVDEEYGGWDQAYEDFFQDGAIFDQIYQTK
ncbi:MAG TPA: sulfate ABC transporter substrate-binding protein [Lachnospiraceae bacterium]|nr:sulfate ABC transporter substrate-binding protein [Lachnospiraceae bacterium]